MVKRAQSEKPRIFISYSRQDMAVVRRLETFLRTAGAEVWVDHVGIRGGDNLPKRISDALEWCNTLLLMWSDAARRSKWVEKEWTNADALDRTIIPCLLDRVSLPGILANKVYVDFQDFEKGIAELLNTLDLSQPLTMTVSTDIPAPAPVHGQLKDESTSSKTKPTKTSPPVLLRSTPLSTLSVDEVRNMLQRYDFYCKKYDWNKEWCNPEGTGIDNNFELQQNGLVVVDYTTRLMWHQSGSPNYMTYADANNQILQMNNKNFASYNDWRLPTLEEAMSLMEPRKNADIYLDPILDRKQPWIWTADKISARAAWVVYFNAGGCNYYGVFNDYYVRAVRGRQS